jgi:hypothetical protein
VMSFNVYLKDKGTSSPTWSEGNRSEIGNVLKALFDEVCATKKGGFIDSDFSWIPPAGKIPLLIYFVDSQAKSLVRKIKKHATLGLGGTTWPFPEGTLSEVYIAGGENSAALLGRLAFHEAMHNLLKMGDEQLHGHGGEGLASKYIVENTPLTKKNKALMAPALVNDVAQYTAFLWPNIEIFED